MTISSNQALKAATAMSDALVGVTPLQKQQFTGILQRALLKEGKWNLIAMYDTPDQFLRAVLTRARLPISAFADSILIYFAGDDKIEFYHNGGWSVA